MIAPRSDDCGRLLMVRPAAFAGPAMSRVCSAAACPWAGSDRTLTWVALAASTNMKLEVLRSVGCTAYSLKDILVTTDGGDIIVDGGSTVALGVLLDDGRLEVGVECDFSDLGRANVGHEEGASLRGEGAPASCALAVDREDGGLAGSDVVDGLRAQVDDIYAQLTTEVSSRAQRENGELAQLFELRG